MILSTKHKFIFWHIPKSAGVAIGSVLIPYKMPLDRVFDQGWERKYSGWNHNVDPLHINHQEFAQEAQGRIHVKQFREFAFIRHPYARAVSMYNYSRQPSMYQAVDPNGNTAPLQSWDTFDEYLVYLSMQPEVAWNKKPQTHWTNSTLTNNGVRVFRVEDLPDAWSSVQDYLNLQLPDLPVLNDSEKRMHVNQLTDAQKESIYRLYSKDFAAFDYAQ